MAVKLLLTLVVAWQVSAVYAAPKIEGQWKSNKALTIATFNVPDSEHNDVHDRFFNIFGNVIYTYTDREGIAYFPKNDELGEHSWSFEYRVEMETKDKLFIVITDPETGEVTKETLHFVSPNRYYITWDLPKDYMSGAREYFDRVDASKN